MDYKPLKKEIVFSKQIKTDPSYRLAVGVMKACGDINFKSWLVDWLASDAASMTCCEVDVKSMRDLSEVLSKLTSRTAHVDESLLNDSASLFSPNPNHDVIQLLYKMMSFLLNVQRMERAISEIDENICNPDTLRRLAAQASREEYEQNRKLQTFKR